MGGDVRYLRVWAVRLSDGVGMVMVRLISCLVVWMV